jgi:uncharacterized protein (TIGR02453 family)
MSGLRHEQGYFTPELFRFLGQLKRNNDREWFAANKTRYEAVVRDPVLKFVADFAPILVNISPHFIADPSPSGGSMMRIYRDMRFSRDKGPYKTEVAILFWHEKGKGEAPAFYLRFEPGNSMVGGGLWRPEPKTAKQIREAIARNPAKWKQAISAREFRASFGMGGESLRRPPRGYEENHPFIEDIKRKDFVAVAMLRDSEVYGAGFQGTLMKHFQALVPYLTFLTEAVGLPF